MTETMKKRLPAFSLVAGLILAAATAFYLFPSTDAVADDGSGDTEQTTDAQSDDAQGEGEEGEDEEKKDEKAPIPVRTTTIETGRVASYLSATANLVADNEVRVIAEWEGRLANLKVDEGSFVEKGQVLAVLAQTDGKILLEKARMRSEDAHHKFQRANRLAEQELISTEEMDKAQLDKALAEQEMAEAEWQLEKTYIRSPFTGRVTARMVQQGQHIRPGDELFTVTDFDPLVARIFLPEKDVLTLVENRPVRITLKADQDIHVDGRIRQISPVVDTATGTVKVTVEAIKPPRAVRPGAFVQVDIVEKTRDAAILLPRESILRELQKTYVFVAEDGVASKRTVTLGLEEDGRVEATDGVTAGERVIVAGQGGLKDGAAVKLLDPSDSEAAQATAP